MRRLCAVATVLVLSGCSDTPSSDVEDVGVSGGGADIQGQEDVSEGEDVREEDTVIVEDASLREDEGGQEPDGCEPVTAEVLCAEAHAECGEIVVADGCVDEGPISCAGCAAPEVCGANGVENRCGVEGWQSDVVDELGSPGQEVSMVLDSQGDPRLTYQANIGGGTELRFAAFDGTSWAVAAVDRRVFAGKHTAMAYDASGELYIAATSFDGALLYNFREGEWSDEIIASTSRGRLGLAFDGDVPHVCVHNESATILVHASRDREGTWSSTTVDGSVLGEARYGNHCSIAVSAEGGVHIAYEDNQFRRLKYAHRSGEEWSTVVVDDGGGDFAGTYTSLVLDSSGAPHISYRAGLLNPPSIRLASRSSGDWQIQTVDAEAGPIANFTALAIDSSGFFHVVYFDSNEGQVKYARQVGQGWEIEPVAFVGTGEDIHSAIALDTDARPHIAFFDGARRRLVHMTRR